MAGFSIIKPENCNNIVPLFCDLCSQSMKNAQDAHSHRKWGACFDCTTMYAEPNREKWLAGWRPEILINDK